MFFSCILNLNLNFHFSFILFHKKVLGEGESRQITLTHRVQIRRFSTDLFKILRNQQSKSIYLSNLPQLFLATHSRIFEVTDYGVCDIQDLLEGLRSNNFISVTKVRETENEEYILSMQKRRQTNIEIEKTSIFAGEVVELLRNAPQFSVPFRKFVRSYHYYFGYQCKLSDYGFLRLAELLDALSGVVEMDQTNEETRKIYLSRKVALRIFSEQIQEIITSIAGKSDVMVKVDELMEMHKSKYGYQMQGSSLGYESVIDALKFVPFVELNSYENELWLISHLDNQKFRQRAMLACSAIIDIGSKVPLSKFHAVFGDKFKFALHEKGLHAMKHAVEIEMVSGIKMISITPMMKFVIHIANILEQRKIMNVQEIKSMLKLNPSTCFNFGYSNLSSLFQAFPDIFNGTRNGVNLHERSDIELVADCPLSPSGLQKLLSLNQVQVSDEKAEIYRHQQQQMRPNPIGFNRVIPDRIQKPLIAKMNNGDARNTQQQFIQLNPHCRNFNNHLSSVNVHSNNPFLADITMPTEMLQNANYNPFDDHAQGYYERNIKFQQHQQQMQAMKREFWNNSTACASNSSFYSDCEASMQQQFKMMTPFSARYEPPKPDTPPSNKPTAIWFDPVWKSDIGMFDVNNRNNSQNANTSKNTSDSVSKIIYFCHQIIILI